jgi:hypothetical protein
MAIILIVVDAMIVPRTRARAPLREALRSSATTSSTHLSHHGINH